MRIRSHLGYTYINKVMLAAWRALCGNSVFPRLWPCVSNCSHSYGPRYPRLRPSVSTIVTTVMAHGTHGYDPLYQQGPSCKKTLHISVFAATQCVCCAAMQCFMQVEMYFEIHQKNVDMLIGGYGVYGRITL